MVATVLGLTFARMYIMQSKASELPRSDDRFSFFPLVLNPLLSMVVSPSTFTTSKLLIHKFASRSIKLHS